MSDFATLVNFLTTIQDNPRFESDTLIIAGNSLPHLIVSAAKFCEEELAIQRVVFVGGIGHGTAPLIENCKKCIQNLFVQNGDICLKQRSLKKFSYIIVHVI